MIRKYIKNDVEQIMKVWYESSILAHPFLNSSFVDKVKSDMRNIYIPNSETWVYENDVGVVGFISMIDNEIGGLFVLPKNHSAGIGTKLVNFVNEFHDELEVEVFERNKIGRAFYDKFGFTLIKEFIHDETGEMVFRLRK